MPRGRKQLQMYKTKKSALAQAKQLAAKLNRNVFIVWYRLEGDFLPLGVPLDEVMDWVPYPHSTATICNEVLPDGTVHERMLPVLNIAAQLRYNAMTPEEQGRIEAAAVLAQSTPVLLIRNGLWEDAPQLATV